MCYGHGACDGCRCRCEDGWKGVCCNAPRVGCPVDFLNQTCGGHGVCLDEGACKCHPRWTGPDCATPAEICPDDFLCYHGVCSDGRCDCDPGYTGDDCSLGPFFKELPGECEGKKAGTKACMARAAAATAKHTSTLLAQPPHQPFVA